MQKPSSASPGCRRALRAWLAVAAVSLSACAAGAGREPMVLVQPGSEEPAAETSTTVPGDPEVTTTTEAPRPKATTASTAAKRSTTTTRPAEGSTTTTGAPGTTTTGITGTPTTAEPPVTTTASQPGVLLDTCRPGTARARQTTERKIVFYRQGPGNGLMWVQPDGGGVELLASDALTQAWWSPDGEHLAYPAHDGKVWVVEADGRGRRSLATKDIIELAWAPDGKRFAAIVRLDDGTRDVFLLDGAGKIVRQLTDTHAIPGGLAWSPDGSVIVYHRASELPPATLWAVSAAGGEPVVLAENAMSASWSPDGCQIAVATAEGAALIRWDGSDRRLLPGSATRTPHWSPGGRHIALEALGGDGIVIVDADVPATTTRIFDGNAYGLQWSPDGSRLAFYGRNPTASLTDFEVFSIQADGTGLIALSDHPEHDVQPHW